MENIPAALGAMLEVHGILLVIAALALYFAFLWGITRLMLHTREQLRCPVDGRRASVTFLRGPDGFKTDFVRCSLLPSGKTCARECLRAA
jgi:hypothetical protein